MELSRLYRRITPAPVVRLEGYRLQDWEHLPGRSSVPRTSLTPILRFADVESYVQEGEAGAGLSAMLQLGVAKEQQPHYMRVLTRPEHDPSALIRFGLAIIGKRSGATRSATEGHQHGVISCVRTYESPVDRRLEEQGMEAIATVSLLLKEALVRVEEPEPGAGRLMTTAETGEPMSVSLTQASSDDLDALLDALPPEIGERMRALPQVSTIIEVVMDLGRKPEARFGGGGEEVLLDREIGPDDLQYVVDHVGSFGEDNRAGIERTLHRISAIRNRSGKIVGLTCRVGRAVFGTIEIIDDLVESGKSILLLGRPGVGKTTMLREVARVLADDLDKRVIIVDTSNEIAGDGDIPHPGIGRARRMQVRTPGPPARGDDRGGREPHARGHRHRRDRHRARGPRGAHHRRARRPAHRHGARQHPRQPHAQPDALRPHRRHPDGDAR